MEGFWGVCLLSHLCTKFQSEKQDLRQAARLFTLLVMISGLIIVISYTPHAYSAIAFNPKVNASLINGAVFSPQIAVLGNNSFVIWTNNTSGNGEVSFARSTNNGVSYDSAVDISHTANDSTNPKIAASGSNIVAVWQELNANHQIYFAQSGNNGISFNAQQNLTSPLIDSTLPQIATAGNNFYVIWIESVSGNNVLFFSKSTNSGLSFSIPQNLTSPAISISPAPTVAMSTSGTDVYVVWTKQVSGNNEIFFTRSTDNGNSFSSPNNISNTLAGDSINPQVAASGNNVYVTWQDDNHSPGTYQIFTITSSNNGAIFGFSQQLSSTSGISSNPLVSASISNVYIVWQGDPGSGFNEVYFARSTNSGVSYSAALDLSSDSGDSGSPSIAISGSNVDLSWIDSTTGSPEIFFKASGDNGATFGSFKDLSNTPTFDSLEPVTTTSGTNVYVAWSETNTGTGNEDIFVISGSGTPSNDVTFDKSEYKQSQAATVRVIATALNNTGNIDVNVTSTSDTNGILLNLPETDLTTANFTGPIHLHSGASNSGNQTLKANPGDIISAQFGGQDGTATIFPRTIQFDFSFYTKDKHPIITITDQNSNLNPAAIEIISVKVNSTSDNPGITFNISESAVDSGIFTQQINLTQSASSLATHSINATIGDTIYASYREKLTTAKIIFGVAPGGGGGGLIKPGFVLDAAIGAGGAYFPQNLVDLVKNLDLSKPIPPSTDPTIDFPFSIEGKGFPIVSYSTEVTTTTVSAGESIPLVLTFYTPGTIEHVGFYFNVHGSVGELEDSDTYILYDSVQPLQIVDPHSFFNDVKISTSKSDYKNKFSYSITFAKPMAKSDVIVRSWDDHRRSTDSKILNAILVVKSEAQSKNQITPSQTVTSQQPQSQNETQGEILNAINEWSGYSPTSISDSGLLHKIGIKGQYIPSWVMKTTKWLVEGQMSQEEFINIMKYLDENKLIK